MECDCSLSDIPLSPFSPPIMDCLFSLFAKITRAANDFV